MTFGKILALIIIFSPSNGYEIFEESLIKEMFEDQNVDLTIATCWSMGKSENRKSFKIFNDLCELKNI